MNAVLIGQEKVHQDLVKAVSKYCPCVSIIKAVSSTDCGLTNEMDIDVVICNLFDLDLTLCDLIAQIPSCPELLVLISDPREAMQAYTCDALHCLLLPTEPEQLIHAMHKVSVRRQVKKDADLVSKIGGRKHIEKICLHSRDGVDIVKHEDILYCTADGAYCNVVTLDGRHLVSKTLVEIERQLNNDQFVRIHASHIINMAHVGRYVKSDGGSIVLDDGTVLPLSRRRRQEFLDRLPL